MFNAIGYKFLRISLLIEAVCEDTPVLKTTPIRYYHCCSDDQQETSADIRIDRSHLALSLHCKKGEVSQMVDNFMGSVSNF